MASKFLKRAMELVKSDLVTTASDYTGNIQDLRKDAKAVAAQIQTDTSGIVASVQDNYKRIKSGKILKDISDWFYNSADSAEAELNNDNDDFDAGMDLPDDDSSSDEKPTVSIPSSAESAKQISAMYKIGAKQAEASVANTAEIITSLNARSAEMIASLQSINTGVNTISEKMDKLIALNMAAGEAAEKAQINNNSLVDENGQITLTRIYETVKETNKLTNNVAFNFGKMALSMVSGQSAEDAFNAGMTALRDKIKIKDKSITQWGEDFNNVTGALIQNAFREALDNGFIKKIFGDAFNTGNAETDYSQYRINRYNEEKAVFDGITRQSIVSIIPGYLKSIDEHLRGRTLNIDEYGNLTTDTPKRNQFENVTKHAFEAEALSSKKMEALSSNLSNKGVKTSQEDLNIAGKALLATYVMYLEGSNATTLKNSDINPNNFSLINYAVRLIVNARGGDSGYWFTICQNTLFLLSENFMERQNFITSVNKSHVSMQHDAMGVAQSSQFGDQAGKITDTMLMNTFKDSYGVETSTSSDKSSSSDSSSKEEETIKPGFIENTINPLINSVVEVFSSAAKSVVDVLDTSESNRIIENGQLNTDNTIARTSQALSSVVDKVTNTKAAKIVASTLTSAMTNDTQEVSTNVTTDTDGNPKVEVVVNNETQTTPSSTNNEQQTPTPTAENTQQQTASEATQETQENTAGQTASSSQNRPDVINTVRSMPGKAKQALINATHSGANKARDVIIDQVQEMREVNAYNATVKEFGDVSKNEEVSEQDKVLVQTVMQMSQTATSDGDVSTQDIQAIEQNINLISDDNIKKKLKLSIIPMLNRVNSKAETDVNANKKGGIVGKILIGMKMAFNAILKPIKAFLRIAFKGIKTFAKKLFSGVIKLFKSGASDVKTGSTALKESIFGVRDADGNLVEDGLAQQLLINPAKSAWGVAKNLGSAAINYGKAGYYNAKTKLSESLDNPDSKLNKALNNVSAITSTLGEAVTGAVGNAKNRMGSTASDMIANMKEKFGESEFGKGFMSVFNKEEIEKREKKLKTPETMTDVNTDEVKQMIEGGKDSIFTVINDHLVKIIDKLFPEQSSTPENNENNTAENNAQTTTPENNTQTTTPENNAATTDAGATSSENQTASTTASDLVNSATSAATDVNGVDAAGAVGKNGGKLFNIGKMLGGITKILGGLGKMILSIVMGMSGIKMILDLVENVLKTALKPLNKVFQSIYKAIKPVVKALGRVINKLAKAVTKIAQAVLKTIMPLIKILAPIIDELWEALEPFIDTIVDSIDVLLKPIAVVMKTVIAPVVQLISASVKGIFGMTQMIYGGLQTYLGNMIWSLGLIVSILSAGTAGKSMREYGRSLQEQGANNLKNGSNTWLGAVQETYDILFKKDEEPAQDITESNMEFNYGNSQINGSILDGTIGSGNVYTYNNYYGSGDQASYGTYMNMGKRGCGPLALADNIERRTGKHVDAYSLTNNMAASGMYNANAGTSVSGFINSANAMGVTLKPGGVSTDSLRSASPTNPITVIGSGTSYGTGIGNNHYVNVIGANGSTAIVSNPLTGKVSRTSTNDLVLNSKLGLYGSGDVDGFALPDSITEPMSRLKELTSGILSLFSFDSGTSLDAEEEAANISRQYQETLSSIKKNSKNNDDYEEKVNAYEASARTKFEADHPKYSWESDDDYEARWEKNKQKYIIKEAESDVQAVQARNQSLGDKLGSWLDNMFGEADEDGNYTITDSDGNYKGWFANNESEGEASDNNNIFQKIFDTIGSIASGLFSGNSSSSGGASGATKMIETAESYLGQHGDHFFSVFGVTCDWCAMFISTCGVESGNEEVIPYSTSCNAQIKWFKEQKRWLGKTKDIQPGDIIYFDWNLPNPESDPDWPDRPVDHVGLVYKVEGNTVTTIEGNSGSTGDYTTSYVKENTYDLDYVCIEGFARPDYPTTAAQQGRIEMSSELASYSGWDVYKNKDGVREFIKLGFEAGMSPAAIATVMSTGIWEDSGQKIFGGAKSLTDVTYDYNGQQAVGIMNWKDIDTSKYGTTLPEQLKYIQDAYFAEKPSHSRGYAIDPYRSGYSWGSVYEQLVGRKPGMNIGDPIGPHMDQDLIDGSSYYYGGALVFTDFPTKRGFRYVATGADAYNWMIDQGIINVDPNATTATNIMDSSTIGSLNGSTNIDNITKVTDPNFVGPTNQLYSTAIGPSLPSSTSSDFVGPTKPKYETAIGPSLPPSVGSYVKIKSGATYYNGEEIPDWVLNNVWQVEQLDNNRAVLGMSQDGSSNIMSAIDVNMLETYGSGNEPAGYNINYDPIFHDKNTPYIVDPTRTPFSKKKYANGREPINYSSSLSNTYGSGDFFSDAFGIDTSTTTYQSSPTYNVYNSTDNLSRADMINALNTMEFNVSAKRLESLVEQVLIKLDERVPNGNTTSVSPSTQNLFNEEIPSNIARLYS